MKIKHNVPGFIKKTKTFGVGLLLIVGLFSVAPTNFNPTTGSASAACLATAPPTTYGQVTQSVTVATAGTYRVWSRIKAPSTSANSYYFQADGGCAYNVGDSTSIPANAWTWVNYQDGTTTSTISITLTAGTHTLTYTGKEADVQLDKVMLLTDTSCVPTGTGDNCATSDATPPAVSITAPTAGATVAGTVNITANATDASGIKQVDFLVDNQTVSTDTTSAYSYAWDTTKVTDGTHTIQVKATDSSGNGGNSATTTSMTVTVKNTTAVGTISVSTPYALNKTTAVIGDTITGTITYKNTGTGSLTISSVKLAGRGPGGTNAAGPAYDLTTTTKGPYTLAAGATLTVTGSRTLASTDPTGAWYSYASYTDTTGVSHDGGNVNFTVTAAPTVDSTKPTVSLTAPVAGTSVTAGAAVTMSATASDNVGVTKVEFMVDGTVVSTDTAAPYTYSWTSTAGTAAARAVTAKAYDAAGNNATSGAVSVTVTAASTNTPGDVNGDKRVNALDLSVLISHDGQNYPAADFNGDGTVGAADMAILLSKWTW